MIFLFVLKETLGADSSSSYHRQFANNLLGQENLEALHARKAHFELHQLLKFETSKLKAPGWKLQVGSFKLEVQNWNQMSFVQKRLSNSQVTKKLPEVLRMLAVVPMKTKALYPIMHKNKKLKQKFLFCPIIYLMAKLSLSLSLSLSLGNSNSPSLIPAALFLAICSSLFSNRAF